MIILLKRMLLKFKIINPIVDYPIIGLALLNCLVLLLIYVAEYYLLKMGIQTPNRFGFGTSFLSCIGILCFVCVILSPLFLLLIRDIISFVTMKPDGGDPVTSLMIISWCFIFYIGIFKENIFYLLKLFRLM